MDEVNLTTHSEEETMAFGEWIGAHAVNDLFIALNGDLGTGKTHFVQGLAKGCLLYTSECVSLCSKESLICDACID